MLLVRLYVMTGPLLLKQRQKRLSILLVQKYMLTSVYEDDEMEELYLTTEEILEEDGKCKTNTIIMGDWNSVVVDKSY